MLELIVSIFKKFSSFELSKPNVRAFMAKIHAVDKLFI